ncbi:FtsW/RodA/SpoVE family cell cycle protein [Piscinibacter koreensis]|uniref:FtsW/RodA/SpoVE family cell cycle protein n=1 Tax=Piscinibacter koreensis TaxID=2742824 RepID=A0A7Y6NRI4_9BURK|nr:FtsW/RodA/SpoVE family cell cycle protein [Schlegelella koreensis]NUZ07980.1 FtsW/RodA/SpoVE family cell cycle protein [Schlegelella koreensis]
MNVARAGDALPRAAGASLRRVLPGLMELALVLAALALLLPRFGELAALGAGRDGRFLDNDMAVDGLPAPLLPAVCAAHGALAEPLLHERLCPRGAAADSTAAPASLPPAMAAALGQVARAFAAPLRRADAELVVLGLRQQDDGDWRGSSSARAAIEAALEPYRARYALAGGDLPRPVRCAAAWAESVLGASAVSSGRHDAAARATAVGPAPAQHAPASARADALLLLAGALDGHAAAAVAADASLLARPTPRPTAAPADANRAAEDCSEAPATTLGAAASLMDSARQSLPRARKNAAMRDLLESAGAQWAGAMALGYAAVVASRRRIAPLLGASAALALWTIGAWAARVPWPFAAERAYEPARLEHAFDSAPATWALGLLGVAALGMLVAMGRRGLAPDRLAVPAQTMSTRIGYAGLVVATGVGWLVLLDLSANGHPANRYLALYHQGHLWFGMTLFSVLLFARRGVARALGALLSWAGELSFRVARRVGRAGAGLVLGLLTGAALLAFALGLAHQRQLTSELGRIWLIVGAAWFFFLRGSPLAERLAHGRFGGSFVRYLRPLLFVVAVLLAAMLLTRDMGPLLIAGYAGGAFLAASIAMWWQRRGARLAPALGLAVLLFAGWIGLLTEALFAAGSLDGVAAGRLESVAAPFASNNDQLALVTWFQQAAPPGGFGVGSTPWCGYAPALACSGVPAQIHSDYTFTAIAGLFGSTSAWLAALGCALWLHRLIRHHGRVTRGEPRLVATRAAIASDGQALLSWVALTWVVLTSCQLAVTVAGNVAVLPLTGVTFPFVSFGMTSLSVNLAFLALCLNLDLPGARDG